MSVKRQFDLNWSFTDSVRTAQRTHRLNYMNQCFVWKYFVIAVSSQIHTKNKHTVWAERRMAEC